MIKVEKTSMKGKALLQMQDGQLLIYKKCCIHIYVNELHTKTIALPSKMWKRIVCQIRLLERALHMDVRWAVELSQSEVLLLFGKIVYKINILSGIIDQDFSGFRGQPFSIIQENDRILFGDYGTNDKREVVNIYERKKDDWHIAFSFPAGQVRHIHNIVSVNDSYYILTGDDDYESGIWKADYNFKKVEPFLIGKQQYRCCQMLAMNNNTGWYLTDAPSEPNWLYKYENKELSAIHKIAGTVIYGSLVPDGLVFSTCIEPDAYAKNKIDYWLCTRPGLGVESKETKVYLLHNDCLNEIASFVHDGKPLRLFQYATVTFSNYLNNTLFFTPQSVLKHDMSIWKIVFTE